MRCACLFLLSALLRSGFMSSAAPAELFTRDPELHGMTLAELLAQPTTLALSTFDVQLQVASAHCRELNALHQSHSDGDGPAAAQQRESERDASYCKRVRYVRQKRERLRVALRAELQVIEQQSQQYDDGSEPTEKPEPREIPTRSAGEVDLQAFFETYAETTLPVILTSEPSGSSDDSRQVLGFTSDDELTQFRVACFDAVPASHHSTETPLKTHDAKCAPLLKNFHVPIFLVHDYVRRTNVSLADAYLPSLIRIARHQSREVLACPHGLHMLAMVFRDTHIEAGSVSVQVVDQLYKPLFQQSSRHNKGIQEVAVSATSGGLLGRGDRSQLLHIAPLYSTRELPTHSLLFVPGSHFTTIQPTSEDHLTLLRFCFVDASNFNLAKQEAAIDALVDADAHTLLQSLQAQTFDRSMFRRPALKDTLWTTFTAWPRETKLLKKSDLLSSEAGSEQLQLSRRERLKQWQDDRRWDRRVESLTLPVARPPVVVNVTRSGATLRFQDLFDLPKHDITAYGYVVRWRSVDDEQPPLQAQGSIDSQNHHSGVYNAMNITRWQLVRSALPTALFGDDFDGKDIEAVVKGLAAETRYTFTVQIYVDDTFGLESDSSRLVLTTPCGEPSGVRGVPTATAADEATCATLKWLEPIDDGGKRVDIYLINARIVESPLEALVGPQDAVKTAEDEKIYTLDANFASNTGSSAWKSAQVCKLVPGATYFFRVAAMNSIGAGPWSARSDPVTISSVRHTSSSSSRDNVPTLKGRGDPAYVPTRSFSIRELSDLVALHGPEAVIATLSEAQTNVPTQQPLRVAILSDVLETIVMAGSPDSDDALSFDVWPSHFSPRAFHVSAEVVRADPLDASTPLRNAAQAKDRVVLVTRGAVPFMFKAYYAQLAGALGIIIADANDTCRGHFDQQCVPGADKSRGEGFAALDRHELWLRNRIPCVLVLHESSQRLLELVAP